ncbi:MAG: hypothetical protein Q8K45_20140 [Rubrivivax sp.]|nr:hypothetical protein [Rubrivivax sp.]
MKRRAPRSVRPALPGARAAAGLAVAVVLFAASPATAVAAGDAGWQLGLRSQQHSDATALNLGRDPRAEDLAPRGGRNLAYIDDEVRLERTQGGWTLGLLARSRATLVVSADTLALYQQVDGGAAVTADRRWAVDARFRGFSGGGLAFGRTHGVGAGWSAQWEVQALVLQRWRERRITGTAGATAASGEYTFALNSVQHDDGLRFPFQTGFPSRGSALLGSLTLAWQGGPWQFEAALKDAGWQGWRGLPRQDAWLDSRTAAVDADGYLIYRPLIQGQNTQATARRSAPAWGRLVTRWQPASAGAVSVEAGTDLLPGFGPLPWLGLAAPVGASQLALRWRTHERRLTLQWAWQGLTLTAGADRLRGAARSRELGLAWQLPI